jgi:hypothetical protein
MAICSRRLGLAYVRILSGVVDSFEKGLKEETRIRRCLRG